MGFDYRTCRDAQGARDDPAICTSQSKETFEISIRDNVTPLGTTRWAMVAGIPVLFGWIVSYMIVAVGRWIRAGFKSSA
jgi:hypothetical protein